MEFATNTDATPGDPQPPAVTNSSGNPLGDKTTLAGPVGPPFTMDTTSWTPAFDSWMDRPGELPMMLLSDGAMEHHNIFTSISSIASERPSLLHQTFQSTSSEMLIAKSRTPSNTSIQSFDSNKSNGEGGSRKRKQQPAQRRQQLQRQQEDESDPDEEIKQRNRVAASKCRRKKKEKTHKLEEVMAGLELRHSYLQKEHSRLQEEVGRMKNHLINHTNCKDPNIDQWIQNEANNYIKKLVKRQEKEQETESRTEKQAEKRNERKKEPIVISDEDDETWGRRKSCSEVSFFDSRSVCLALSLIFRVLLKRSERFLLDFVSKLKRFRKKILFFANICRVVCPPFRPASTTIMRAERLLYSHK